MAGPKKQTSVLRQVQESLKRARTITHLVASSLTITLVMLLMQIDFDGIEGILVDSYFRIRPQGQAHPDIALIAYDDLSATRYLENTKIPVLEIEQIFEFLSQAQPRAVGLIADINDKNYSTEEMEQLGLAFQKVPHTFIGYTDDESLGKLPPSPLQNTPYMPGFISRDNYSYGADGVSRRVMLSISGIPTLYATLAPFLNADLNHTRISHQHRFKETGSEQVFINWQGTHLYETYSSQKVAKQKVPLSHFRDKVVLISSSLKNRQSQDYVLTPFSRRLGETTVLEAAAQGLSTLAQNNAVFKSSFLTSSLVSIFTGLLIVNMVILLAPMRGILFTLASILGLYILCFFLFTQFHLWFDLAHPILVASLSYYLVIPYRLVNEYRIRAHYQNESQLMRELEELKSNFLSLVSHDLKTPIARIQSNAELLLGADKASQPQKINDILSTTESLSRYVESILDLTRVDSKKVKLNKSTKDINSVIQAVVESKKPYAQDKQIQVHCELEPLFAFSFDDKLIQRVLENLLENAIKYSPRQTHIRLTSVEESDYVQILIEDEGPGIAKEDQERIFAKFYRCQHDNASEIKGTGLGLYLVKYFVELHHGFIELESEVGMGSRFKVSLPV